jgi:stage IV sporulation protein FB
MEYLIAFSAISVHEAGHMVIASLFDKKIYSIRILPLGLNIDIEIDMNGQWKYILIYLAGPVTNILLSAIFFTLRSYCLAESYYIRFLININIYLAVFNILPVLPLDGGRILNEMLNTRIGLLSAAKHTIRISLAIIILIILTGVLQFYHNPSNFSLILIGIFLLFSLKSDKTEASLMNIKRIVNRRSRLLKKGVYPVRDLVVIKSTLLRDTIKNMDFDQFHIIHVLDDNLRVIKVFTEQELLEAMINNKGGMTFDELISSTR